MRFPSGLRTVLLAQTTITTATTVTTTPPLLAFYGANYLAVEAKFLYGAGGTSVDAYIQTSLDYGVTWVDVMNFSFTTAAASKISAICSRIALAAAITPTDGTLTSNTILNGLVGDRLRVKYVTVGTYTGATSLYISAVAKG